MYRDLTDTLRSAEALERKEMDLGTLRTYRTPFPQGSSDPFTDTGVRKNGSCSMSLSKAENSDARTAKERMREGARSTDVRFTNTDSFAVCTVLDEGSGQLAVKSCRAEMHTDIIAGFVEK